MIDRPACEELDARDPLALLRGEFLLEEGLIYLDGNSLGALPRTARARISEVVDAEWGRGLIRSWNDAGWFDAPVRVGDKIARLIGAGPGEVVAADSTSVNLFKLLAGALAARPIRRVILTEKNNFPTDLYVAQGLVRMLGDRAELRAVDREELRGALDDSVAVLMLTHVDYVTGAVHDMAELTRAAHQRGALALWDLSHSTGAVPVDLAAAGADLAVGCGYKFLNGGPGAPAYMFVAGGIQEELRSPLTGWMGHADPFSFGALYEPAADARRYTSGTPAILSLAALEAAIDLWLTVDLPTAFAKTRRLTDLFIETVEATCADLGVSLVSSTGPEPRGGQVALHHQHAYPVMRGLIAGGVIGDYRPPGVLRFGFPALYTRYVDAWDAVERLRRLLVSGSWQEFESLEREAVT